MRLLPKGFAQLLPIVQWLVGLHLGYIEEAARGTLAYVIGAPSEEEAIACVLWIFEGRYEEADREALAGLHESSDAGLVGGLSRTSASLRSGSAGRLAEAGDWPRGW